MEKSDIADYIKKLKELDSKIDPNNISNEFANELNVVLSGLGKDIESELGKRVQNPAMMDLNFRKLREDAVTPTYANDGDAGLDLTITHIISDDLFQTIYGTGLSFEVPRGYVGLVFPRSSVRKHNAILANCVGVLDMGFRGEIELTFNTYENVERHKYEIGESAAQLVIIPFPKINLIEQKDLSKGVRGDNGHGSSGK